jgi:hypothetical protein
MKNLFVAFLLAFSVVIANAQPKIQFKKTEHDYGQIKEDGGEAVTVFEFTNSGNAPLILSNVSASCGCTTPGWTREPVAPGKSGQIKVAYNPKGRPGSFRKTVTVNSNAAEPTVMLSISGNVAQREKTVEDNYPRVMGNLRFKTNYISFGDVTSNEVKAGEVEFINNSTSKAKITVHRTPAHLKVRFEPAEIEPGKEGKMIVDFDAPKKGGYGYISDRIYLAIDGEANSAFSIGTSATIKEDFTKLTPEQIASAPVVKFDTNVFDFGNIKEGESSTFNFKMSNTGKSDLLIRDIKTTCGCTTAKNPGVVKPGETVDLTAVFNSRGKRGRQNKSISIITNDPNNSTVVLRMIGNVEAKQ